MPSLKRSIASDESGSEQTAADEDRNCVDEDSPPVKKPRLSTNEGEPPVLQAKVKVELADQEEDRQQIGETNNQETYADTPRPCSSSNSGQSPPRGAGSDCSCYAIKCRSFAVTPDMYNYFARKKDEECLFKPLQQSVPNILVELDPNEKRLVVKSFSAAAIRQVEMLGDSFLANVRQRMGLGKRQAEVKCWEMSAMGVGLCDANYRVQLEVQSHLVGLAFGPKWANFNAAQQLPNVLNVNHEEKSDRNVFVFTILADTSEAAQQARLILEFVEKRFPVPCAFMGEMIGRQGRNLRDVIDKSGLVRITTAKGTCSELEELVLIGNGEAIDNAELMLNFQMTHIREMKELRSQGEELREFGQRTAASAGDQQGCHQRTFDNHKYAFWTNKNTAAAEFGGAQRSQEERDGRNSRGRRRSVNGGIKCEYYH